MKAEEKKNINDYCEKCRAKLIETGRRHNTEFHFVFVKFQPPLHAKVCKLEGQKATQERAHRTCNWALYQLFFTLTFLPPHQSLGTLHCSLPVSVVPKFSLCSWSPLWNEDWPLVLTYFFFQEEKPCFHNFC